MTSKEFYIGLSNGMFKATSREDLQLIFASLKNNENSSKKMIVHFHGGLVSSTEAHERIENIESGLLMSYQREFSYPIFFVWESSLIEVITSNLKKIYSESVFQRILKRVAQFVKAKIFQQDGTRGLSLELESIHIIATNLSENKPFKALENRKSDVKPLNDFEKNQLKNELINDYQLASDIDIVVNDSGESSVHGKDNKGSLLSNELIESIRNEHKQNGSARGHSEVILVVDATLRVLENVITRLRNKTDHGVYVTIVEEILRFFYIDNIGRSVWDLMKQNIANAFHGNSRVYGGTAFLEELNNTLQADYNPQITLIGHSAGSIYICNLLAAADRIGLDEKIKFDIIMLAPACTFKLLASTIQNHSNRIRSIRCFGMTDEYECADRMLGVIYPHSLLYFVSGLLEDQVDEPIVGMQRYYSGTSPYLEKNYPSIEIVKNFLDKFPNSIIWSKSSIGEGLNTESISHGGFDDDIITLSSIIHIVEKGFS